MSLPRFFLENQVIADEPQEVFPLRLTRDDAKHAKVLRLAPGEHIAVIDAAHDYFECEIASLDDDFPLVRITRHEDATDDGPLVMLVQGLAKGEKMDSVIRHATELGVAAFMPLTCERSIVKLDAKKTRTRLDRWCSIAKSAAMQSGQPRIPEVLEPRSAKEAAVELAEATAVLICWEEAPQTASLAQAIGRGLSECSCPRGDARIAVVVGPEGGLTEREVGFFLDANPRASLVSLGSSVLRTETAGVVAPALTLYELGKLGGTR